MSNQIIFKDICLKCQKEDFDLVRPCNNNQCQARFHQECLSEMSKDNNKCTECDEEIVVTKVNKFSRTIFINKTLTLLAMMVLIIMNAGLSFITISGSDMKNLSFFSKSESKKEEFFKVLSLAVYLASVIFYAAFMIKRYMKAKYNGDDYEKFTKFVKTYCDDYNFTLIFTSIIIFALIFIALSVTQLLGYIISLCFGRNDFLNLTAFCLGFFGVCIFGLCYGILAIIGICYNYLHKSSIKEEIHFGVKVDNYGTINQNS